MKINVKENILCNNENLEKYLPKQYITLVSKQCIGQQVNLIYFPIGKVVLSSEILRLQNRIEKKDIKSLYFADTFTIEAQNIIIESNGITYQRLEYFWTDDSYKHIL